MFSTWLLVASSCAYLALLFGIAAWGDRAADRGRILIDSPTIYTLSLGVWCTAWTFFGSVDVASTEGLVFLPVFLGPVLAALLFPSVLHKMLRIAKTMGSTSIADFLAARYGKSGKLGALVTIVAVIGAVPYISIQLEALASSVTVLLEGAAGGLPAPWGADTALSITLLLALFCIIFGTRSVDATETHQGMVLAVAFESVVKLVAFVAVGIYLVWWTNDGLVDLIGRAEQLTGSTVLTLEGSGLAMIDWLVIMLAAACAIFVLPRQFHLAVIENVNERHLYRATWLFPLYLLIITLFILPMGLAGIVAGQAGEGMIVLRLPVEADNRLIASAAYFGGLSAASAMIIVATIALSTMISNDLVMPVLLRLRWLRLDQRSDLTLLVLAIRRAGILVLLIMGYGFFRLFSNTVGIVQIGLISVAAVIQFMPAILAALYWREARGVGAIAGLLGGFVVWFYTLIVPALAGSGWLEPGIIENGPWGVDLLRPQALMGLSDLHPISHAVLWSLSVNVLLLVIGSLWAPQSDIERLQALLYVDVYERDRAAHLWRGDATLAELRQLLVRFFGHERAARIIADEARDRIRQLDEGDKVDAALIEHVERHLARAIGAVSARIITASTVRGETIRTDDLLIILNETSQVIEQSQRLLQKSRALEQATAELKKANDRLTEIDRIKDEFLASVSHELRTPLTSIRSFSEILIDAPDLEPQERKEFLEIIVRESERLTRLINNVLDLSKIESGRMDWHVGPIDLHDVVVEALAGTRALFFERGIEVTKTLGPRDAMLVCDRDRLVQVVVNLLSNACRFARREHGQVHIALERRDRELHVRVEDNGPGIEPRFRHVIFEKFRQADDDLSGHRSGTGLGLAICRQIVDHFGGRIWVEESPLGGAAMCVALPALSGHMLGEAA